MSLMTLYNLQKIEYIRKHFFSRGVEKARPAAAGTHRHKCMGFVRRLGKRLLFLPADAVASANGSRGRSDPNPV